MRKIITKRLIAVILTAVLLSLVLNYFIQVKTAYDRVWQTSQELFWQIEQILKQNEAETEQVKKEFAENCLIRAKAAAYIVQYRPEMIGNQPEMEKVAALLQVDEFHLFDTEGNLYAGSQPKYFGLNFNSGEQMQFFLPMLSDPTLRLCQDITPNTAEQKLMQYAAVWREDGKGIVQIGMEPERVLDAMKKNELSYIFSLLTADQGATIYAIDPHSGEVLGSTKPELVGKNTMEIGLDFHEISSAVGTFHGTVSGQRSYGVFKAAESVILARTCSEFSLYTQANLSSLLLGIYLLLLAFIIFIFLYRFLNKHIIKNIADINHGLEKITKGDLDTALAANSTPEFTELSSHINEMVKSLLETTSKLSVLFDAAKIPIGVYEYHQEMKRVMTTKGLKDILMLSELEERKIISDYHLFEAKLAEIRKYPVNQEETVFYLPGSTDHFVRIEAYCHEESVLGIVIDVTDEVKEKKHIEHERDVDLLTDLYSRRAFYKKMEKLFASPQELGHALLLMADADHLKQVNDQYGHEVGDYYLKKIADVFHSCKAEKKAAARLSGDEFVLFLYGCASQAELDGYIDDMVKRMKECRLPISEQEEIPVSFSWGCAYFPEEGTDFRVLLRITDERMYQDKKRRK